MPPPRDPKAEAAAWIAKLSQRRVTTDLREFNARRDDPTNDAAYCRADLDAERLCAQLGRFVFRPDAAGFSVTDTWTGDPAEFATTVQTGISEEDAREIAELLNRRAIRDDLPDLQ